jgi:hypothetical protein
MTLAFGEVWELRLGPDNRFRVFYRFIDDLRLVRVLGILVTMRAKLYFGDEEFDI